MDNEATTTLFRPVGRKELELIRELKNRGFPPRLWHQPIAEYIGTPPAETKP